MNTHNVNKKFLLKILLPTFLAIGLFFLSIFQIIIPRFEEIIMDRKREMIKELTNSTISLIEEYHKKEIQGKITKSEAQNSVIELIQNLRYGEEQKDYFWITDLKPYMIIHPYRPELNGKDLSNFEDSHGKKLFVEIVNAVGETGEAYVNYMWQWKDDSTRIVPKLSYVKKFEPWGWIIGTGIYIEDVKLEIARLERSVINISIGITVLISLLLLFIALQNIKIEKKRLQAEIELKESKEKYKALVEAATEGLIMVLENDKIYYNKTILSMLGYDEEEISRMNIGNFFLTEININDFNTLISLVNSNIEMHLKRKDGNLIDVLLNISQISFMGNQGVVIAVRDISRHKQIETALDESEERYTTLTNQLTIGVFRLQAGKEMKFIEVNPATINMLGCRNKEELLNTNLTDYFEDEEDKKTFLNELSRNGYVKNKVVRLRRKDNALRVVSISMVTITNNRGRNIYYDGILEDITQRTQADEVTKDLVSELRATLDHISLPIKPFIKKLVACDLDLTLSKVSALMSKNNTEIVLVKKDDDKYLGIIEADDLRRRILEEDFKIDQPVYEIMKSPPYSIKDTSTIFEALRVFYESNVKHLVVKDNNGKVCGTVSYEDLIKDQLLSYLFFVKQIEKSKSFKDVRSQRMNLLTFIRTIIESGADTRIITHLTTIISDTVTRKVISLAQEEVGPAPVNFVFMAMGSEGREEQTLATDQDNAIIFEDISPDKESEVRSYFSKLSEIICDELNIAGYTFCKGGIMAKNPKWCQSLKVWKKYFSDWVNTASPKDLLDINIFFDFRPIYGDENLTKELREHLFNIISGNNPFFLYLAENALKINPPAAQIKSSEIFDIKLMLLPIVDIARIYGLKYKISSNNTLMRLNHLYEKNILTKVTYQDIVQAYDYLMKIRFLHQSRLVAYNIEPDNKINPSHLSEIDRGILRRTLTLIENFQHKLSLDFKGTL